MKGKFIKRLFMSLSLIIGLIGLLTVHAGASTIVGDISFSGNTAFDSSFTEFTSFSSVVVNGGSGTYGSVPTGNSSPPVTFTPFTFSPPVASVNPLWTFSDSGVTYSFEATTVTLAYDDGSNVVVKGDGIASVTGYTDTGGTWSIPANKGTTTASFSASTVVPEPATMLLLGSGLLGMGVYARRKFHKKQL